MDQGGGKRSSRVFFRQFLRNLITQFLGQADSGYSPGL
jgi:hypothetical protein